MKFCPMCSNVYADTFETCPRDQTVLQMLPPVKSSKTKTVLIVAGSVAAIFVVGLVLSDVILSYKSVIETTNQTFAINSMKQIYAAETQYRLTYPERGYSCSLAALGGKPDSGAPTLEAAQLLDPHLAAAGIKSGYLFSIDACTREAVGGHDVFTSYKVIAVPITVGKTGDKGFCSDQEGRPKGRDHLRSDIAVRPEAAMAFLS